MNERYIPAVIPGRAGEVYITLLSCEKLLNLKVGHTLYVHRLSGLGSDLTKQQRIISQSGLMTG